MPATLPDDLCQCFGVSAVEELEKAGYVTSWSIGTVGTKLASEIETAFGRDVFVAADADDRNVDRLLKRHLAKLMGTR